MALVMQLIKLMMNNARRGGGGGGYGRYGGYGGGGDAASKYAAWSEKQALQDVNNPDEKSGRSTGRSVGQAIEQTNALLGGGGMKYPEHSSPNPGVRKR